MPASPAYGRIKPVIDPVLPIRELPRAFAVMRARGPRASGCR
jgi:hypothetical protein